MLNTVSSCHDQLESLQKLKNMIGPETWCDCLRLVDRCEIFRPFLKDLLSSVELLEDINEKEEKHLNDLEKTLLDAELYVKEFVLRPDYFGITECTYRQGCSIDFSKVVRNVIKLAQDLNVGSDTDFDKLRTEDLEDIRKTLEYSYLKVAEEIEQVPSKERLICALFKDLESYQYIIMKFLALNKHMALTVSETKMLKSDTDRIRKVLEARFPRRPEVVSTVELVPYKAASASRSHDNTLSDDSSASSATSAGSGSTIRTDNSEESIIIDNALASKLIRQEALTTEQAARRMKTLSKLRLQTEDVLISTIKIGQGGFGDIVLGNYKRKFKCAIKTVANVDDPLSDSKRQTIENELLIMKYLGKYRTILQCYGYLMSRNDMHIVLELSPYGSLDKLLKEATIEEFPINLTLAWMKDLADAMRFLHEHDIRHRDLKAENMLLFDKLTIKLCDFGPAKHHLSNVTADDNSGIICFLAPETRVGQVTDLSADIFSFAMTVIQIMTRKNPKIDHFKDQVVDALMKVTITNANVSRKLHSLLTSCVAYDPSVVSQSTIRPTAETVFMTLHELLENDLGGDPRFLSDNASKEAAFIKDIEVVAYMKQNDRLKKAPKSGTLFRGRSGASGKSGSGYKKNMKAVSYDQYEQSSFEKAADYSSSHNKTNYSTYSNATGGPNMSVNYTSYSVNQTNFTANNDPQTIEDKNQMVKFLRTEIKLTLSQSIQVAEILVRNGVINVTVLRRRLIRNKDFLLDIGLDDDSSLDILEYMISTAKDQAEIDNLRSSKRYSRRFGRENQDIVAKLPNETARLYYEASQCNRSEALIALRELESSGDQLAQGFIMRMMAMGQGGIKKDHKAADEMGKRLFPWLQDAVARGSTDIVMYARYLLGVCYSEGLGIKQDLREAIRWYKLSSSQGYNAAQAYLGYCYFTGTGIPRNIDEALRYYKLGAELGHAGAQCNLGLCYEHGYGVAKDKEAAVKWYTHAAEQGDIAALFNLGYCCERGHGVPENIHQAVKYYKASASAGYTAAQHNLGLCYYFGNGVDQNISEAVVWLRLSAEKGYAPAQCKLGLCFENGHGVRQDFSEAVYWYRQSAEQGDAAALYYLGFCYFSGTGVELNYEEAVRYYKESAAKNYPPALNNLGFCYFNGMGLTKNYTMAVKYYRQSAELGYAPAQYNMGYCYEKGFGVVKKLNTVIKWYRLASENGNEKAKKELAKYQAL